MFCPLKFEMKNPDQPRNERGRFGSTKPKPNEYLPASELTGIDTPTHVPKRQRRTLEASTSVIKKSTRISSIKSSK
jgi:hypothetical protein